MKKNLKQLMLLACIVLGFVACTDDSSDNELWQNMAEHGV